MKTQVYETIKIGKLKVFHSKIFSKTKELLFSQTERYLYESKIIIFTDIIEEHIGIFNRTLAQFRRRHSPNRRYLPSIYAI